MAHKITKVNLDPSIKLKNIIGAAWKIINDAAAPYESENPWHCDYAKDDRYYLYRNKIGAIGRVRTCDEAVKLGLYGKTSAMRVHFVNTGLFQIYKIARYTRNRAEYIKKLEEQVNFLLSPRSKQYESCRFTNYNTQTSKEIVYNEED